MTSPATARPPDTGAPPDAGRTRDATFPLFDSLRGIAAIMVFLVHGLYQYAVTRPDEDPGWYRFVIHLDVAVPIFFAISGFLLYRPFVSARVRGRRLSVRAYARRRFLRIAPAYWVALPVIVLWFDLDDVRSAGEWLWHGLFLQLYDPDTALGGVGQAWTLAIEVTYYAFLPLWVWLVGRVIARRGAQTIRAELLGVGALVLGAWAWQAVTLRIYDVQNLDSASITMVRILPIQFDHLGAGMLLAVLSVAVAEHRRAGTEPPLRRLLRFVEEHPGVLWAAAAAIWLAAAFIGRSGGRSSYTYTDKQFYFEHILYTPVVFLLLAPAVFGDGRREGVVRRLLAWRPLAFVGLVSYSFYLWHIAVIGQQARWWGKVPYAWHEWIAWLVPSFAASLAVAAVSFFAIERPFMNLKRRVPREASRPSVDAAGAR